MGIKIPRIYLRYSIWISAATIVVLIVLLGLTIYSVRERAIIDLFSTQQTLIAQRTASRAEESIRRCERGMLALSRSLRDNLTTSAQGQAGIQALADELQDVIQVIVTIDADGVVRDAYPSEAGALYRGFFMSNPDFKHTVQDLKERYTGEMSLVAPGETRKPISTRRTIGTGFPVFTSSGDYNGAVLAFLKTQPIVGRSMKFDQKLLHELWLVDAFGRPVAPTVEPLRVKTITGRQFQNQMPPAIFFSDPPQYREIILDRGRGAERCIIAYAPIRSGIKPWWIVLVTPYEKVLEPIRRASFNIVLGAFGLIAVVIITAISLARADVKRLRMKEQLKRLQEREEWQGKLLREKMTVAGIIEGSPVPMFVIDQEHKVILWNRACTDLTGYSSEEMIGTNTYYRPFYETPRPFLADFIIDHHTDSFDEFYGENKVMKSETISGAYEAVKHFKNLRGKDRHLHFLAAPIFDEKGAIVAAIETFLDVTKEVETTKILQEYAETLQNEVDENIHLRKEKEELSNYLESIIESLPDKIYDLNKNGIINYASRHLSRSRQGRSDPAGKHFSEYVAPEHRDYVVARWEDAQRGIFEPYELDVTARDGTRRHLILTPSPVKGTDRFVLVQRDITQLKELEKKYYESQKLAAIGQLSAGIAHEVRNPLSSIKMSLQILEKRMQPTGNDLKRFRIAQREVEHLEKLVSDVLIFAKPTNPQKELVDMCSLIEHSLSMVEQAISDKQIDVHRHYQHDREMIAVDPAMFSQTLINIFLNAIDAMGAGGKLGVSVHGHADRLIIEIEDNGCGIAEEDLPHLYNPFFTRKNYGTGLGLTQVKKIIDQHSGEIDVLSKTGEGTRFIIALPKGPAPASLGLDREEA